MKKFIILTSILVIIGGGVIAYLKFANSPQDPLANFRTEKVTRGDITLSAVATGKIYPLAEIEVKSKIGGVINKFFVEEGDMVEVGQKLAEVIPGATPIEMVRAREELRSAELEREKAEKNYLRNQQLLNQGLISTKEFDEAKTAYYLAEARYYAAKAELQVLEYGGKASPGSQEEPEKGAEIQEAIKSMLLRSPIKGIVLSRETDEGTTVVPLASASGGTVIMTIADVSEMYFKGDVDESDMGMINEGMPVSIKVESFPEERFKGVLTRISPLGREKENIVNFEVQVKIQEETTRLRAGMSADAEIIVEKHTDSLLLLESAIVREEGKAYVYLPDPTTEEGKKKVEVELGISDGIHAEILKGLKEGDEAVIP